MPKNFSFAEIAQEAANGATSLAGEVAVAARNVYCTFAQNSPFSVIYNNPLTAPIVTRALTSLCGSSPPPPPPPPFEGGQCVPILYRVYYEYKAGASSSITAGSQNVYGSVRGLQTRIYSATTTALAIVAGDGSLSDTPKNYDLKYAITNQNPFPYYAITSVERLDGQPDNCGSPPSPWYPEAPPPSNSSITNVITTVTNSAGDSYDYDVTINRSGDEYIKFPPVLNVNGISVGIDATGVSIGELNINRKSGGGGGDGGDINQTPEPEAPPEVIEEIPEPIPEEFVNEDTDKLVGIYVDITGIPSNAKIVSGNGAPNVIYAGWIEFKRNRGYFPRQFIDFENSWYPAPAGATGYAVTLKRGYTGSVQKVVTQ